MFLVTGAVLVTWIFYRSREKQLVIERGLDVEMIREIFKKKEYPYALLKMGIIIFFFGLGLGIWIDSNVSLVFRMVPFYLCEQDLDCKCLLRWKKGRRNDRKMGTWIRASLINQFVLRFLHT